MRVYKIYYNKQVIQYKKDARKITFVKLCVHKIYNYMMSAMSLFQLGLTNAHAFTQLLQLQRAQYAI